MPNLPQILERLEGLEFTIEAISDFSDLEGLITSRDLEEAERRGHERLKVHIDRTPRRLRSCLTPGKREELLGVFEIEALCVQIAEKVLDHFRVKGKPREYYLEMIHEAVMLLMRDYVWRNLELWPRFLSGLYGKWITFKGLSPRIVKAMLMIVGKICYRFTYGEVVG